MNILVGTSGFSFKEWVGNFYPQGLKAGAMLGYYGRHFGAVEINNTFYRMPKPAVLKSWAEEVPADFRFVLKASQRITHHQKLKDCAEKVRYLLEVSAALGERLGPLLFQLPPTLRQDLPLLRDFLALLPTTTQAALEFRHESWFNDEVYDLLRAHDAALCIAEAEEGVAVPFVATATWGYLRLRRGDYTAEELQAWGDRVRGEAWTQAFVFFKHEEEAPKLAQRFMEALPSSASM
jgi:uncharacterized protein YecE (DUF72 family)